MKQAPQAHFERIDGYFSKNSFQRSPHGPNSYVKTRGITETLIIHLYVDDLVYTSNNDVFLNWFKGLIDDS